MGDVRNARNYKPIAKHFNSQNHSIRNMNKTILETITQDPEEGEGKFLDQQATNFRSPGIKFHGVINTVYAGSKVQASHFPKIRYILDRGNHLTPQLRESDYTVQIKLRHFRPPKQERLPHSNQPILKHLEQHPAV